MTLSVSAGGQHFTNHVDFVIVHSGTEFWAINKDPGTVVTTVGKKQLSRNSPTGEDPQGCVAPDRSPFHDPPLYEASPPYRGAVPRHLSGLT
jgi:hypothetical protein